MHVVLTMSFPFNTVATNRYCVYSRCGRCTVILIFSAVKSTAAHGPAPTYLRHANASTSLRGHIAGFPSGGNAPTVWHLTIVTYAKFMIINETSSGNRTRTTRQALVY